MSSAARPGYRETVGRLAGAQKAAARSAPAYSRFVNRRLGRYLAAWAYRAGLTPDGVTGVSGAFTFGAIALLALAPYAWWTGVLVAALLLVGYAFDSADGQLARLRGGGSPAGEWLDHMVDALKVVSLPLALLVGLWRAEVATGWLAMALASAVVSSVLFFGMILTEQLRRQAGTASLATDAPGRPSWLRSVLVVPTDYGLLCLSFLLLGALDVFLVVYAAITAATAGFLALAAVKWFREMRRLPRPAAGGPATP